MQTFSKNLFTESKLFLALFLTSTALLSLSISQETAVVVPPLVAATNAAQLLSLEGKTVRVTGKIIKTGKSGSGHNFLNFENSSFVGFTPSSDLANFTDGPPADLFKDKFVEVTGLLERYQDNPEIVIKSPDQIKIIDPSKLAKEPSSPNAEPKEVPAPIATKAPADRKDAVDWRLYFK